MRSMHFMPVIVFVSFQMSKTNLKVASYWIKADILKQFTEYFCICLLELQMCEGSIFC